MRYLVLFLMILTGCGHRHQMSFAPGTYMYVQRFFSYGYADGRLTTPIDDLIVTLTPQDVPHVGRCIRGGDFTPVIQLDPFFWNNSDDMDREQLIFHELGHCILGRGHTSQFVTLNGETIPQSIMYPDFISEDIYTEYHDYYIIELFSE